MYQLKIPKKLDQRLLVFNNTMIHPFEFIADFSDISFKQDNVIAALQKQ